MNRGTIQIKISMNIYKNATIDEKTKTSINRAFKSSDVT